MAPKRRAASRTAVEAPEREADHWNVRYRRLDTENKWKYGHLLKQDGLIVELADRLTGGVRVLDLSRWDVEFASRGPRGGIAWEDIVLKKEGLDVASA